MADNDQPVDSVEGIDSQKAPDKLDELIDEGDKRLYELLRLKAIQDVREELTKSAKQWLSIVAVALTVLGSLGILVIVPNSIQRGVQDQAASIIDNLQLAASGAQRELLELQFYSEQLQVETAEAQLEYAMAVDDMSELRDESDVIAANLNAAVSRMEDLSDSIADLDRQSSVLQSAVASVASDAADEPILIGLDWSDHSGLINIIGANFGLASGSVEVDWDADSPEYPPIPNQTITDFILWTPDEIIIQDDIFPDESEGIYENYYPTVVVTLADGQVIQ